MGRPRTKTVTEKRSMTTNKKRTVESEMFHDKQAKNLQAFDSDKKGGKKPQRKLTSKEIAKLTNRRKRIDPSKYAEKDLNIPALNKAVAPGIKKVRGKKGKVFADKDTMLRIVATVNEKVDQANESKLEKARNLEQIRELRRKEMEEREKMKKEKLDKKKSEIKSKLKNGKISSEASNGTPKITGMKINKRVSFK